MSSEQGGSAASGTSPAEHLVRPHADGDAASGGEAGAGAEHGAHGAEQGAGAVQGAGAGQGADGAVPGTEDASPSDEEIAAAGGRVVGEAEIGAVVDRTRVRRAPRYKRFAVLGGLLGLLIAAIATPFASYDSDQARMQGISAWTLFLVLASVLVPFGILVSCAVAMISDRAARLPARVKRTRKRTTKESR